MRPTIRGRPSNLVDRGQVKKLVEDIDAGYDTWKQGLEKKNLDDAVITSAERTVKVKDFLKDFEKAIDVLKDRFKPD